MASPLKTAKPSSQFYFSSLKPELKQRRQILRSSMKKKTVIIPYDRFMGLFVPKLQSLPPDILRAPLFSSVPTSGNENYMYRPLTVTINNSGLLQSLLAVASPHNYDPTDCDKNKPDLGLYAHQDAPQNRRPSWSKIVLTIECKPDYIPDDPFDESEAHGEAKADKRRQNRAQIFSYAALVLERQHLTCHFMVIILGDHARIARFDRSGVVVTHPFPYHDDNGRKLAEFLWHFDKLSPQQRGIDDTVRLADANECDQMRTVSEIPLLFGDHARLLFKKSLDPTWPWWRICVDGEWFLVGKPTFMANGLAGRGTRGYVAYRLRTGTFVYLKDAWRIAYAGIRREGDTLILLQAHGVMNVPTCAVHGDVDGQVTLSQDIWSLMNPAGGKCPLKKHQHYRLVVNEVGLPMEEFRNGAELITMILECLYAHEAAYLKAHILHRDISAGNVLIYPKLRQNPDGSFEEIRTGMLNDWELSKEDGADDDTCRQPDRTGTRQFMSAAVLNNPKKRVRVQDELEGFLHLVVYFAARYLSHNFTEPAYFITDYFDMVSIDERDIKCGILKMQCLLEGRLRNSGGRLLLFKNPDVDIMSQLPFYVESTSRPVTPTNDPSSSSPPPSPAFDPKQTPLNMIIQGLFQSFSGYYSYHHRPTKPLPSRPSRNVSASRPRIAIDAGLFEESILPLMQQPTNEDADRYHKAEVFFQNHQGIIRFLSMALINYEWPRNDKVNDQIPSDYATKLPEWFSSMEEVVEAGVKRGSGLELPPKKRSRSSATSMS